MSAIHDLRIDRWAVLRCILLIYKCSYNRVLPFTLLPSLSLSLCLKIAFSFVSSLASSMPDLYHGIYEGANGTDVFVAEKPCRLSISPVTIRPRRRRNNDSRIATKINRRLIHREYADVRSGRRIWRPAIRITVINTKSAKRRKIHIASHAGATISSPIRLRQHVAGPFRATFTRRYKRKNCRNNFCPCITFKVNYFIPSTFPPLACLPEDEC